MVCPMGKARHGLGSGIPYNVFSVQGGTQWEDEQAALGECKLDSTLEVLQIALKSQ